MAEADRADLLRMRRTLFSAWQQCSVLVCWPRPLTKIPEAVPAADRERIVRDGTAAIRESVLPAYREFLAFMSTTYLPRAAASGRRDGVRRGMGTMRC